MGFDAIYINVPAQDVPVTALLWSARVWLYVCVRVKPSVDELMPQAISAEGEGGWDPRYRGGISQSSPWQCQFSLIGVYMHYRLDSAGIASAQGEMPITFPSGALTCEQERPKTPESLCRPLIRLWSIRPFPEM